LCGGDVVPRSMIGVLLSFAAVLTGVITGILVKRVGVEINIGTTLFYRFLFSLPFLFLYGFWMRGSRLMQINQPKILLLRTVFGCCGIVMWFMSLRVMPFGMATALFQSSVLFVTLLSPLFLGEKVGIYRWSAVVAGLTGVVIITNPFSGEISWVALYGVGAALAGAGLALVLRQLGKGDEPVSVACWYNMAAFLLISAVLMLMPDQLQPVSLAVTIDLLWLGFVGFIMQIVITTAYRYADAVVVASMRYLQMPMSGIVGYWLFAEVLAASEIIGAVIIIGSCLVIAWREVVRSRQVSHPGV